jgi:hypothetical protein
MPRLLERFVAPAPTASRAPRAGRRREFRPQVEALESRRCPSCTVTTADGGHTLVIADASSLFPPPSPPVKGATDNAVWVYQDDSLDRLSVFCDGSKKGIYSSTATTKVQIDLKGGDDSLDYRLGSDFVRGKLIEVKLGAGNDRAWIDFGNFSSGPPRTIWAPLSITVQADDPALSPGRDDVGAHFGTVSNAAVRYVADGGGDNDILGARLWGDLKHYARVAVDLRGAQGDDDLFFWAAYDHEHGEYGVDIYRTAALDVNLGGGAGDDLISASGEWGYTGRLDGRFDLRVSAGAGGDEVVVRAQLRAGGTGSFSAAVKGEADNDTLTLEVEDLSAGTALWSGLIDGGAGFDTGTASPGVLKTNCEA